MLLLFLADESSPVSATYCGHTANHRHQTPQVCLCDQCGGYYHLLNVLLDARTPLSGTSHGHEYPGEYHVNLCTCTRSAPMDTPTHTSSPFLQALNKKHDNKLKEAKRFSFISFAIVLIFAVSYPILITVVILAPAFGYTCDYQPNLLTFAFILYSRPYGCG